MVARLMLNTPGVSATVELTEDEKSGAKSLMNAIEVKALFVVKVLLKTWPVKVMVCPPKLPSLDSRYRLASMVLLPTAPGPPLGVYQNSLGSPMLYGASVN